MLRNGENAKKYAPYIPDEITFPENLDRPLLYRLRTMTREDIAKLPDVGEGLENRIADAAVRCSTSSEIADLVKTKLLMHAYGEYSPVHCSELKNLIHKSRLSMSVF